MCIYYSDEFGYCGINGFNWGNLDENKMCDDMNMKQCPDRITVEDAEKMRGQIDAIKYEVELIESFHKNPICLELLSVDSVIKRIKNILND